MGRSSTILITTTGLSWGNYGGYAFGYIDGLNTHGHSHGRDRFAADARAGRRHTVVIGNNGVNRRRKGRGGIQ